MTPRESCTWTYDHEYGNWECSCGEAYQFIVGTPEENHVRWCPFCGGPITFVVPPDPIEVDE